MRTFNVQRSTFNARSSMFDVDPPALPEVLTFGGQTP
jgi:hypothetical protein